MLQERILRRISEKCIRNPSPVYILDYILINVKAKVHFSKLMFILITKLKKNRRKNIWFKA